MPRHDLIAILSPLIVGASAPREMSAAHGQRLAWRERRTPLPVVKQGITLRTIRSFVLCLALALPACGNITVPAADGGPSILLDARVADTDAVSPDAGAAVPPAPPRQAMELVPASGRVSGGGYTLELQLGHSMEQGPSTGGGTRIEGGAAIKP